MQLTMLKKILIATLFAVLVIQLLQPTKNVSSGISENDISKAYDVPLDIHKVLVEKCYDCHSNNTRYPWYVHIQPIGWWLASHIKEGREHLDFSEFKTYSGKKATHKLEELSEAVTEGWMPLSAYVLMHKNSRVTPEETTMINNWITSLGIDLNAGHD
jgi:hypothetical protein